MSYLRDSLCIKYTYKLLPQSMEFQLHTYNVQYSYYNVFIDLRDMDSPDLQEQCMYRRLQLTQSKPASTANRANMPYLDLSLSDVVMSTARPSLCRLLPALSTHPSITRSLTFGQRFITLMANVFSFSLHLCTGKK